MDVREREQLSRAATHYRRGELDPASEICHSVLKKNRASDDAMQLMGLIAFMQGEFDQAIACYRKCIAISPQARFHYLIGKVHIARGETERAIAAFNDALRLQSGHSESAIWKAVALERRGEHAAALAVLQPLVAAGMEDGLIAETLARIELHHGRFREAIHIIDRSLESPGLPPLQRQVLLFVRASALERAGDLDEAFAAYVQANESLNATFDPTTHAAEVDRIIQTFSAERLKGRSPIAKGSAALPVFIAGMPRSGTTLIEQIIDAHPAAFGAGEIKDFEEIQRSLDNAGGSGLSYPESILNVTPRELDQLARRYRDVIRKMAPKAQVVVNKSLENWRHVGLIALILPDAKIIHCHRDPLDTCISCYFSHLMPGRHGYASNLTNLGKVYRNYERLMSHWQTILADRILQVRYESLVRDQESVSRAIVGFCGLPWDDRCLRFHQSGRVAMTLSYDQVRKPIYDSSIGRAARFAGHLEPLRKALDQD